MTVLWRVCFHRGRFPLLRQASISTSSKSYISTLERKSPYKLPLPPQLEPPATSKTCVNENWNCGNVDFSPVGLDCCDSLCSRGSILVLIGLILWEGLHSVRSQILSQNQQTGLNVWHSGTGSPQLQTLQKLLRHFYPNCVHFGFEI